MTAEHRLGGLGAEFHALSKDNLYQRVRGRVFETDIQPPLAVGHSESPAELLVAAYRSGDDPFKGAFEATCLGLLQEIGDKHGLEDGDQTALANLAAIGMSLGAPSLHGEFRRFVLRGCVQQEISFAPDTEELLLGALINTEPQGVPLDPIWQRLWEDIKPVRYCAAFTVAREHNPSLVAVLIPEFITRQPQPSEARLTDMIFHWWQEYEGNQRWLDTDMGGLPYKIRNEVVGLLAKSEMSDEERKSLPRIVDEPQVVDRAMFMQIRKWQEGGAASQELIRWLQGNDLPLLERMSTTEPYEQILGGIPRGLEDLDIKSALAQAAASILDKNPDVQNPAGDPEDSEKFMDNLLMLCAGLGPRDELNEQLWAMYERRALEGEYRGLDLRDSLVAALMRNQTDARLHQVWSKMLSGSEQDFLPGDEWNGWYGVLYMPESREQRGPFMPAIVEALSQMAKHLENDEARGSWFRSLILDVARADPAECLGLESYLAGQAQEHKWPQWAVDCLSAT